MNMNTRTLTVILNSNHSKRFALSFTGSSKDAPAAIILREARNKFRIRGLSIVFLRGGILLDDSTAIKPFTEVWVSKGEPYSGPPAHEGFSDNPGDVRIIADRSFIDDQAVKQLKAVATLPGVRLVVGMPDLHPGNRFPIGCAIAADGIYPALIGSDVGCGIALYHFSPPSRTLPKPGKLASLLKGLDEPWSGSVTDWLANYGITKSSPFDDSLGTVGAGNHFAEICTVEEIVDETLAESLGIEEGGIYLLVHTGSRGLGASILAQQTSIESNPYIPNDSPHLPIYLAEHDYAVHWAIANRDLVAHRIKQCAFPTSDEDMQQPHHIIKDLGKIVDVTHNSVTPHLLYLSGESRRVWIHRKGAAPADKGVVPCPGSRGDFSWLLQPIDNGEINAHSIAHGAGRRYGRNVLHNFNFKVQKSSLTTTTLGSEVVCTDPDLLVEERPEAYKDVKCVVDDMTEQGICKGVVVLRPFVTYKVREGGQRRQ